MEEDYKVLFDEAAKSLVKIDEALGLKFEVGSDIHSTLNEIEMLKYRVEISAGLVKDLSALIMANNDPKQMLGMMLRCVIAKLTEKDEGDGRIWE